MTDGVRGPSPCVSILHVPSHPDTPPILPGEDGGCHPSIETDQPATSRGPLLLPPSSTSNDAVNTGTLSNAATTPITISSPSSSSPTSAPHGSKVGEARVPL